MDNKDLSEIYDHGVHALDTCEMLGYNLTVDAVFICPKCHKIAFAKRYIAEPVSLVRIICNNCGIDIKDIEQSDLYELDDEWDGDLDDE